MYVLIGQTGNFVFEFDLREGTVKTDFAIEYSLECITGAETLERTHHSWEEDGTKQSK